jgi:predicted deacetylase
MPVNNTVSAFFRPALNRQGAAMQALTVVIHDVAPATLPACQSMLAMIAAVAPMPVSLLVVPRYHGAPSNPAFECWLDEMLAQGHELALHGYTHQDEGVTRGWADHLMRRWYTAGEGEFAGLDEGEAARRLAAGRDWFAAHDWPLHGFVAPAWLMSSGTRQALADQRFAYTATLSRLIELPSQCELPSQSIVFSTRTAWRRASSLVWNRAVAYAQRQSPLLRLELHPTDLAHPAVRASWSGLLADARSDREAMTVADAVHRLPATLWQPGSF